MLKSNAWDNVTWEHLEYYSLHNLVQILNYAGLEIFGVMRNKVNGGSLRVYASFPGKYNIGDSFYKYLNEEDKYFKNWDDPFKAFSQRIQLIRSRVVEFIQQEVRNDKKVYLMGASTKANTLLQYFGLNQRYIPYAAEVNEDKFGLYTVGTNILIIPECDALRFNPNYFLIGPWHFATNLIERHHQYLENGGAFILPMPIPMLVTIKEGQVRYDPIRQT
jgi:hypothetical protein